MQLAYSTMQNLLTATVLSTAIVLANTSARAADADLAPLPLKLPLPTLKGTPDDLPKGPNIEPPTEKPRPPFLAPKGVRNLALNKKVIASVKSPFNGDLTQITDGTKEAFDDQVVELRSGVQWVQLDLGEVCEINALVVWHDHRWLQVFRSVVVLAADDPDFVENVKVLYNNDTENAAGLGIGTDKQYFETQQGRLIPAPKGLKTRYLRFFTKGSNLSGLNCYQEIEVYGLPGKP
jgi:hypothetical protein